MKRITGWMLSLLLVLALVFPAALAENGNLQFSLELSVNGQHEIDVLPGEIVTVVCALRRTDGDAPYTMYGMQDEIRYDKSAVSLVDNGIIVNKDVRTENILMRSEGNALYMNYLSMTHGTEWNSEQLIGSFQIQIAPNASGVIRLTSENYSVSLKDGSGSYPVQTQDLTLRVSSECTVRFESNGGSAVEEAKVQYGTPVARPEDPTLKGYHLEGWYSDFDLENEWAFENAVTANMTLYAKWAEGDPIAAHSNRSVYYIGGGAALLALILLLILLLKRKCRVTLMVGEGQSLMRMKVKKNSYLHDLPTPNRKGRTFAGWYRDENCTIPWDEAYDKVVKKNTRLDAKWN